MRSLTVDLGGPVHVADFGGDGPPMVLVHGLGGHHLNWLRLGPRLAERFRVYAPDLAGFGRTVPAGRRTTMEANRSLLDRFVTEVVGAPAILVGNSMGGLISILEAAAQPEKVAGLVLVDPAVPRRGRIDPLVTAVFTAYLVPGMGEAFVRRRYAQLGPEGLVRETLRLCCVDPSRVPADVVDAHVELARWRLTQRWTQPAFLEAARSLVRTVLRRARFDAAVRRITAPTLLLHGVADRLVSLAAARRIASLRPDWSFRPLGGLGHTPQLEDPDRILSELVGWLEGPGRAAVSLAGESAVSG